MTNPKLTVRFDQRWLHGVVGRRDTRIVKNARLYLATSDGQVTKVGWGDLCLEQWHLLRQVTRGGLGLVAFENSHGTPPHWRDPSEEADATLKDLIPGLALGLAHDGTVLLNHPDPDRHTLGAISLPALDRQQTPVWLAERLDNLTA